MGTLSSSTRGAASDDSIDPWGGVLAERGGRCVAPLITAELAAYIAATVSSHSSYWLLSLQNLCEGQLLLLQMVKIIPAP
jgi:hypothetical protein